MICLARVCGANVEMDGSMHGASGGVPFCRIAEIGKGHLVANVGGGEASGGDVVVEAIFDAVVQAVEASFEPGITQGLVLGSSGNDGGMGRVPIAGRDDRVGEGRPCVSELPFGFEFLAYWSELQFELQGAEVLSQDIRELLFLGVGGMSSYQGTFAIGARCVFPVERELLGRMAGGRGVSESVAGGGKGATEDWMAEAQSGRGRD
jgi:hypothetical protein